MRYHYRCPVCGKGRVREWAERGDLIMCNGCRKHTNAPAPDVQPDAWVDEHDPPREMAAAARRANGALGGRCTVPGCTEAADALDHRVPYDADAASEESPGRTCVRNLFPMCTEHNSSKGEENYAKWLKGVARRN